MLKLKQYVDIILLFHSVQDNLREMTGQLHKFLFVQTKTIGGVEFHQCIRTPGVTASADDSGNSTKNCKYHRLVNDVVVFGELGWLPSQMTQFEFMSSVTHTVRYAMDVNGKPIIIPGHAKLQFRVWHINKISGLALPK
jgi:hypothetical protein